MSAPDENDLPDEEIRRMWRAAGGSWLRRLDDLVHHPRMRWVPRLFTGWVCDLWDHRMGATWDEVRRTRHGKQSYLRRYWGSGQTRTFNANTANGSAKVTIK